MQGIPGSQLQQSLKQGRSLRVSKLDGFTAQSYNYRAMWNYAERYWLNYNPAYRGYGNDCTNFISQIMTAGGWAEEGTWSWERQDPSKWFYGDYAWTTSYTWAASHNWAEFAVNHSHRTTLIHPWQVLATDIVQVDWTKADGSPGNDGVIDHSMFVTSVERDSNGEAIDIGLTYHSKNRYDRSIWDVSKEQPGGIYYFHRT